MQLYSLRKIPPLRLAELGCHVRMNSNTERSKRRCNTTKMQCYAGNGKPTELNCVDSSAGSKLRSFLLRVILPKLEVCQSSGKEAGKNGTHPEELLAAHLRDTVLGMRQTRC